MIQQLKLSKIKNRLLWAVQVVLAASFVWAGVLKLIQPIEKLAAMWPWVGQVPLALVKLTGLVDILGALGLILPALLRLPVKLTSLTAIGIIVLMFCAIIFHVVRGEVAVIGVNIGFAVMAAFVAWGRWHYSQSSTV